MGRLSKRTIQCRAARKQRDLQHLKALSDAGLTPPPSTSTGSKSSSRSSYGSFLFTSGLNFGHLQPSSLRRYSKAFGLDVGAHPSQEDLLWAVMTHFSMQRRVEEVPVLRQLVRTLRREAHSGSDSGM